jgi:hypothetical protein
MVATPTVPILDLLDVGHHPHRKPLPPSRTAPALVRLLSRVALMAGIPLATHASSLLPLVAVITLLAVLVAIKQLAPAPSARPADQ